MATEYVGVRLDQALVKRIDAVATALDISRSAVLDRVIRIGLREEEDVVEVVEGGGGLKGGAQRLMMKALISSDFTIKLMQIVDDIDPERVKTIRKKFKTSSAKKSPSQGKLAME